MRRNCCETLKFQPFPTVYVRTCGIVLVYTSAKERRRVFFSRRNTDELNFWGGGGALVESRFEC